MRSRCTAAICGALHGHPSAYFDRPQQRASPRSRANKESAMARKNAYAENLTSGDARIPGQLQVGDSLVIESGATPAVANADTDGNLVVNGLVIGSGGILIVPTDPATGIPTGENPHPIIDPTGAVSITEANVVDLLDHLQALRDADTALGTAKQSVSAKNQPSGYAGLDSTGKLIVTQLPAIATNDTFVAASQSEMTALTAQVGDICRRTDTGGAPYLLTDAPASTAANWVHLNAVVVAISDVPGLQAALDGKASVASVTALNFYDVAGSADGKPTAGQRLFNFTSPRAFTLKAADSVASVITAATASTVFDVHVDGVSIGSLTFPAGPGRVGTFSFPDTAIAKGDRISLIAPASPDSTLSDPSWTFVGPLA